MMIFLGGFLGFGGIVGGTFWLLLHLCGLESFGVPYVQIVHRHTRNAEDRILRKPMAELKNRPYFVPREQSVRLKQKVTRAEAKKGRK